MNCFRKWFNAALAVLLAATVTGCETFKDHSLTGDLWQKDPTASVPDQNQGKDYLYGGFARATLTPFTVAADTTAVAAALGGVLAIGWFVGACQEGLQLR